MEDNEKISISPSTPDDGESSDDTSEDSQELSNTEADSGEERSAEKPKKFWERHPKAKNILQGAGVAAVFGGLLLIVKSFSHSDAPESTPTCSDENCYSNASADKPYRTSVQAPDDVSALEQCQEEVGYEKAKCNVRGHLMKLAKGKHASEEKIQEAHENGFKDVPDDMTYRSEHPKEYQRRK